MTMAFKAISMLALATLFSHVAAESQSSGACSDNVCASNADERAALGSAMLQTQQLTHKAEEITTDLTTENVTCKCDAPGRPQKGFTCSNGHKAYCGHSWGCMPAEAWVYPPDWSKICAPIDRLCGNAALMPGEQIFAANSNAHARMQADGNLVVYTRNGHALWSTNTHSNAGSKVVMQDDCNLVVYDKDGKPLWDRMRDKGKVDQAKHWWQKLKDHATNIYNNAKNGDFKGAYESGKNGYQSFKNNHLCADHTSNDPKACLVMQGDCNLVVYSGGGRPLWDSKTSCR